MRKILVAFLCALPLAACDKHDPILPGDRTAIFATSDMRVLNESVPTENLAVVSTDNDNCPYTQDSSNIIRNGNRKIFTGFPTPNSVTSTQSPVCSGNYVYAGLTTGELVKVNASNRNVVWIADIYTASNMTGGASVVDIIAPLVLSDNSIYVGGLGNAFCRINANTGAKKWCAEIGVATAFIVTNVASFVVGTDNILYAVRNSDGAIYWTQSVKKQAVPKLDDKIITVGKQKIDATTGNLI